MSPKKISIKALAMATVIAFSASVVPIVPAAAALIGNAQVAQEQALEGDRAIVDEFMNRDDVRSQFEAFGVDPNEADLRVSALSDAEVAQLAEKIKSAPAGQGLGGLVGAAVLIFIVLLITDLLGFTDVFGFTNKGSANPG